ncbi:MAG TPA: TonB-dependent receptor [Hyphomonas sp.]|nr:TonB-dependent receptor [Hyphomonas sp.]
MKRFAYNASALTLISAVVGVSTAYAQEEETHRLETVTVTSEHREESLQKTPLSITAVTDDAIEKLGIESTSTVSAPNFVFPEFFTSTRAYVSVRGIFQEQSNVTFEGGFAAYLDGVHLGRNMSYDVDTGDIERIEILRGPQGTLYGKNTIAGVMNIITKQPDTSKFSARIKTEIGNYELIRTRGMVNIPLIKDVLAVRASAHFAKRDGYVTSTVYDWDNSDRAGGIDASSGRVQLLFTPNEKFTLRVNADTSESDNRLYANDVVGTIGGDDIKFTDNAEAPTRDSKDDGGGSITADYLLDSGWALASITGYRKTRTEYLYDEDGTAFFVYQSNYHDEQENFSQEFRVVTPKFEKWDAVAGLYYFDQFAANDYNFLLGPGYGGPFNSVYLWEVDTISYAAYANANLHLTDKLTLSGGVRLTEEKKDFVGGRYIFFGTPYVREGFTTSPFVSAAAGLPIKKSTDLNEVNYSVGAQYQFTPEMMGFVRVADGFKSPSLNQRDGVLTEPEYLTSYEAGLKTSWFDNRLIANLTGFYSDYQDLQVRSLMLDGSGNLTSVLNNAASVTAKGFELELNALPINELSVNLGIGYVDSTYDEFERFDIFNVPIDAAGNHVPMTPKWSVNGSMVYEKPVSTGGTIVAGADFSYLDKRYSVLDGGQNGDGFLLPSLMTINGRVGYKSERENWEVYLWGKNLLDEDVAVDRRPLPLGLAPPFGPPIVQFEKYQEPRTYGLALTVNF